MSLKEKVTFATIIIPNMKVIVIKTGTYQLMNIFKKLNI